MYFVLRLFDHYRATDANLLVALAIVAGVGLLRVRPWREVGIGLLTPLALYVVGGVLIAILGAFVSFT